jgi:hypothetical protein
MLDDSHMKAYFYLDSYINDPNAIFVPQRI